MIRSREAWRICWQRWGSTWIVRPQIILSTTYVHDDNLMEFGYLLWCSISTYRYTWKYCKSADSVGRKCVRSRWWWCNRQGTNLWVSERWEDWKKLGRNVTMLSKARGWDKICNDIITWFCNQPLVFLPPSYFLSAWLEHPASLPPSTVYDGSFRQKKVHLTLRSQLPSLRFQLHSHFLTWQRPQNRYWFPANGIEILTRFFFCLWDNLNHN